MHIDMQPDPVGRAGSGVGRSTTTDEEATVGGKQREQDEREREQDQVDARQRDVRRAVGTIQHTYPERGFGFIRCTEGARGDLGQDFFFHLSGLDDGLTMGDLLPGSLVEFECREVPRGKRAEHVSLAR